MKTRILTVAMLFVAIGFELYASLTPIGTSGGGGGGDALTTNPLSQFAATTSLQLKGVISDETGSGALAFATSPTLVTPDFTTGFTIGTAAASGKIPIGNGTNYVASTPTYPNSATLNKILIGDGTNITLGAPAATTQVIYNSAGTVTGDSSLTYATPGATTGILGGGYRFVTGTDASNPGFMFYTSGTLGNALIENNSRCVMTAGGANEMSWGQHVSEVRSDALLSWSGTTDPTAAQDTAFGRNAAGVVEINNGTLGTLRDLKVRNLIGTTSTGIFNDNQANQSQIVVSATEYYLTSSNLNMPAVYSTAIAAGTTMRWRFAMNKTAAGTGTFQILLKKGTNGTTADATLVTQTIGTQTAAADNMECDVTLTWTSATAAYWSIIPRQSATSGTGFGLVYPAVAAQFNGTISGQTTTTASDKYGLSVVFTTGTPTFTVPMMQARAFGVN